MTYSGKQLQDIQRALLSAFPTRASLEQFVQFQLGENLQSIAGGDTLAEWVFSLIRWANSTGRIDELIREAITANPGNQHLQAMVSVSTSATIGVLFLASDPSNLARLRLGEELREIQERLQLAKLRDRFRLEQRMSIRPGDVSQALLDFQPQIVHFSGHGSVLGSLYFETINGEALPVTPDALEVLFAEFSNQVQCVILNACYSEAQAESISRKIPFVIGMNQSIGDRAAIAFTTGFYQALGAGRTIEESYRLGCVQIQLQGISEQLTPVLLKSQPTIQP